MTRVVAVDELARGLLATGAGAAATVRLLALMSAALWLMPALADLLALLPALAALRDTLALLLVSPRPASSSR